MIQTITFILQMFLPAELPQDFQFNSNLQKIEMTGKKAISPSPGCIDKAVLEIQRNDGEETKTFRSIVSYCNGKGSAPNGWVAFPVNKSETEETKAVTLEEITEKLGGYSILHKLSDDKIFFTITDQNKNARSIFYLTPKTAQRFSAVSGENYRSQVFISQKKVFLVRPDKKNHPANEVNNFILTSQLETLEQLPSFFYDKSDQAADLLLKSLKKFSYSELLQTLTLQFQFSGEKSFCVYDIDSKVWLLTSGGFLSSKIYDQFKNKNKNLLLHISPGKGGDKFEKKYYKILLNGRQIAQSDFQNAGETLFLPLTITAGRHQLAIERYVAYKPDSKYERDRNVLQFDKIDIEIDGKQKLLIVNSQAESGSAKSEFLITHTYNLEQNSPAIDIDE